MGISYTHTHAHKHTYMYLHTSTLQTHMHKHTHTHTHIHAHTYIYIYIYKQTNKQTNSHTYRQTDMYNDIHNNKQTYKQANKQTNKHIKVDLSQTVDKLSRSSSSKRRRQVRVTQVLTEGAEILFRVYKRLEGTIYDIRVTLCSYFYYISVVYTAPCRLTVIEYN